MPPGDAAPPRGGRRQLHPDAPGVVTDAQAETARGIRVEGAHADLLPPNVSVVGQILSPCALRSDLATVAIEGQEQLARHRSAEGSGQAEEQLGHQRARPSRLSAWTWPG